MFAAGRSALRSSRPLHGDAFSLSLSTSQRSCGFAVAAFTVQSHFLRILSSSPIVWCMNVREPVYRFGMCMLFAFAFSPIVFVRFSLGRMVFCTSTDLYFHLACFVAYCLSAIALVLTVHSATFCGWSHFYTLLHESHMIIPVCCSLPARTPFSLIFSSSDCSFFSTLRVHDVCCDSCVV